MMMGSLSSLIRRAVIGFLLPITGALACRTIPGLPVVAVTAAGVLLSVVVFVARRAPTSSTRSACEALCVAVGTAWITAAAYTGITPLAVLVLAVGVATMTGVLMSVPAANPGHVAVDTAEQLEVTEPTEEQRLQSLFRRLAKADLTVTEIRRWERPDDGMDVHVALPEGFLRADVLSLCAKIQSSPQLRLPSGCLVTPVESEYQCEAVIRIMLRDCLQDRVELEVDASPASVNDDFDLILSPQGGWFRVSLRIFCMIIGGTTGSGKTTLLDRIVAHLARCTDCLIWVVDFNGGGLGASWNRPYEEGLVDRPIIDWLAPDAEESAVLLACAKAVAKSRKTDPESVRLRRERGTKVLPVSAGKPAIIVLTDEGGEVRQSVSVLGQIVNSQIASLAQIGRETAVRVVMSVLRGTADLLDKGLRAVCAIRVCLRMDEDTEYPHVLGTNPGRLQLRHVGSAWIYRTTVDGRPIVGRSVDVPPGLIELQALSCAHHRPVLDDAAQLVCAKVTVSDVFMGKLPLNPGDLLDHPALVDAARGQAYVRRHDRRREMLDGETTSATTTATTTATTVRGSATSAFVDSVRCLAPDKKLTEAEVFAQLTSAEHFTRESPMGSAQCPVTEESVPMTATVTLREHLASVLLDVSPHGLRAGEIESELGARDVRYSRGNMFEVLKSMIAKNELSKQGDRYYSV